MNFTSEKATIGKILQSEHFYSIPKYQRNYVWKINKVEELWEDILFTLNEGKDISYFLGSIIVKIGDVDDELIDGQQRLTSILVLLSIICKEFIKRGDDFNRDFTKKYCVLSNKATKTLTARLNNPDHPVLAKIVDYCTNTHNEDTLEKYLEGAAYNFEKKDSNFLKCYECFKQKIQVYLDDGSDEEAITRLEQLRESITNIAIVKMEVEDQKSACLVFETINARGQRLEIQDLIKNYLFMYEDMSSGVSIFEKIWNDILSRIENSDDPSLSKFFTYYCTSFFGKQDSSDIFSSYKTNTPRNAVSSRIQSLDEVSIIYEHIVSGSDGLQEHNELNDYLARLNKMRVVILRPLLISVLFAFKSNKIEYKPLCQRMKKIVDFFSIYVLICHEKTNSIEKIIYEYAYKLNVSFQVSVLDEFIDNLKEKKPEYEKFEREFIKIAYTRHKEKYSGIVSSKSKVDFILSAFELYVAETEDFILSKFSIEHIKDDYTGGNACYIGNLVLLPPRKNGKLARQGYKEKQAMYEISCFAMTRKFAKHPKLMEWDDAQISKRGKHMAKEFYEKIWTM